MSKEYKCEHGIRKYYCIECGGNGICEHGKRKSQCIDCKGGSVCEHLRQKSICRDCNGSQFCIHEKLKRRCHECNGSSFCLHEKRKDNCIICCPSTFCIHKKRKNRCLICGGSQICIHEKLKEKCFECGGSIYCIHKKRKTRCKKCDGRELCKTYLCEYIVTNKYDGYCSRCFLYTFPEKPISRNYRTKEFSVVTFIKTYFTNFTWRENKKIEDGCSLYRPDLFLDMGSQIIIIEIDENQHRNEEYSCENKRIMTLSQDVGHRPIVFIRFNPDSYCNEKGEKIKSCWGITKKTGICKIININEWNMRLEKLKENIEYWIQNNTTKTIELVYLYYNENENEADDDEHTDGKI